MTRARAVFLHVLLLGATFTLFEFSTLDVRLQDTFYLRDAHRWLIGYDDPLPRAVFYTGAKGALILLAAGCLAARIVSTWKSSLKSYRRPLAFLLAALAVVPMAAAAGKRLSHVYTPAELERYGGDKPYVKVFESYPAGFVPGENPLGWPAGHASGGFSLMALWFVFRERRWKIAGLALGLAAGWTMGLYQMLKGAHFLSHTVVMMQMAWILILILAAIFRMPPDAASEK